MAGYGCGQKIYLSKSSKNCCIVVIMEINLCDLYKMGEFIDHLSYYKFLKNKIYLRLNYCYIKCKCLSHQPEGLTITLLSNVMLSSIMYQ